MFADLKSGFAKHPVNYRRGILLPLKSELNLLI